MSLENKLFNVFTDIDNTITGDGSIDPLGLRILWTSLGNKIFKSKLNTVSTDIRYYTLNLFNHHIIERCFTNYKKEFSSLSNSKYFRNQTDLIDGLVIFIENLLTHSSLRLNNILDTELSQNSFVVPGINKLKGRLNENDAKYFKVGVRKDKEILTRQILLGIHGRHKGPFKEMGLFHDSQNIYSNMELWNGSINKLFQNDPWKKTADCLIKLIKEKVIVFNSIKNKSEIEFQIDEILTKDVLEAIKLIFDPLIYKSNELKQFWENFIGLNEGEAKEIYELAKVEFSNGNNKTYQDIIKEVQQKYNGNIATAITVIEPILTCFDNVITRLLFRSNNEIDNELIEFAKKWLNNKEINIDRILQYCTDEYFNAEAKHRLEGLCKCYQNNSKNNLNPTGFLKDVILYHRNIMDSRGQINWISIGVNNKFSITRSFNSKADIAINENGTNWINNYYLNTVHSLYNGLYNA